VPTYQFSGPPYVPRIFDTQTGALMPWSDRGAEDLEFLGCSPWRDRTGQHYMAARSRAGVADQPLHHPGPVELVRCTFPAGQVVDRVEIDPLPRGSICWAPDRSDRIVFTAGDGQLYRYDFSRGDVRGGQPGASRPVLLHWASEYRRSGTPCIQDPCWPVQSMLDGQMLVSLVVWDSESRRKRCPQWRLWWVQLDGAVRNIIAVRRAIVPDSAAPDAEERLPSVGRTADGTLLLAYLARPCARVRWELWVAPIGLEASGGTPEVLASEQRRLADGCEAIVPTFSPDGRWVFAALHDVRSGVRMHRFEVPDSGDRSWNGRDRVRDTLDRSGH
jgi:hypothetical protein